MNTWLKSSDQCLIDTLIADHLFLQSRITFSFWCYVQEFNTGILSRRIEDEMNEAILKELDKHRSPFTFMQEYMNVARGT